MVTVVPTPAEESAASEPPRARPYQPVDLVAGAIALLLPIAFSTAFTSPFWTPKAALLLLSLPFLVLLAARSARRLPLAGGAAIFFVAVCGLATALTNQRDLAFFGAYSHGVGFLFYASLAAMWMLGLRAGERGVHLIERALLAATLVNAAFSLVQPLIDLSPYGLGLLQSRTPGLMGNPVHTAALFMGGYALVAHRCSAQRRRLLFTALGVIASGIQLSGSRAAFVGCLALALALLLAHRNLRSLAVIAVTVAGLALGQGVNAIGHGVSGTTRVDEGLGGQSTAARLATWRDATEAIAERPLFGHGPGRYLAATAPNRSLELARLGPERYFRDAHNIVVELATTVGMLGALGFIVWVVGALRRSRGPLLYFAVAVLAIHLVQPVYVGTTPLALLALGAAWRHDRSPVRTPLPATTAAALTGIASLAAAAALVRGDAGLAAADLAYSPKQAVDSTEFLPNWPEPLAFAARMEVSLSITERDDDRFTRAVRLYRAAADADPEDPRRWNELGGVYLGADDPTPALAAYRTAVERNPYSYGGLTGTARAALALNDPTLAAEVTDRAAEIVGDDHPTIVDLRRRIRDAKRTGP